MIKNYNGKVYEKSCLNIVVGTPNNQLGYLF